ncbi:MAG TPA: hypothetical protein VFE65_12985 [Pseudonocardia sp.]|jgi:hypothetical protein|nr:hypothetical protein [Pseudonocardia sp.]
MSPINTVAALWPGSVIVCGVVVVVGTVAAARELYLLYADAANRPSVPPATAVPSPAPPPRPPVRSPRGTYRELSTPQLCWALRSSYLSGPCRAVGQPDCAWLGARGNLLDEIEHRDPAGFNRWLESLPQADDDPARYLTPGL